MTDNQNDDKGLLGALGQIGVETARDLRSFLGRIFGPAASECGELFRERVGLWRLKNLTSVLNEAKKITQKRGIDTDALKSLPFGDALRTVETASYEEEETVQILWSRLIANAVDPKLHVTMKKVYIDILRSISAAEAAFLQLHWELQKISHFGNIEEVKIFNEEMNALAESCWRKFGEEDRQAAIQNLVRIRCITFRPRGINLNALFAKLPDDMQGAFGKWAAIDPEQFQKLMDYIDDVVSIAVGIKDYRSTAAIPLRSSFGGFSRLGPKQKIEVPEMNFMLTALGADLMRACQASEEQNDSADCTERVID